MNKLPYLQSEGFAILCYFGKISYVGIYFGIKSYRCYSVKLKDYFIVLLEAATPLKRQWLSNQ